MTFFKGSFFNNLFFRKAQVVEFKNVTHPIQSFNDADFYDYEEIVDERGYLKTKKGSTVGAVVVSNTMDTTDRLLPVTNMIELLKDKNSEFAKIPFRDKNILDTEITKVFKSLRVSQEVKFKVLLQNFLFDGIYWLIIKECKKANPKFEYRILLDMCVEEYETWKMPAEFALEPSFFSDESHLRRALIQQCPEGYLAMPYDLYHFLFWKLNQLLSEQNFLSTCKINEFKVDHIWLTKLHVEQALHFPRLMTLGLMDLNQINWSLLFKAYPWVKDCDDLIRANMAVVLEQWKVEQDLVSQPNF